VKKGEIHRTFSFLSKGLMRKLVIIAGNANLVTFTSDNVSLLLLIVRGPIS
jgi:hypothetical protein